MNINDRISNKKENFHKSLRDLVTILFAIVFGIGLEEINNTTSNYDLLFLILAYISIILSWWGYHWGTIHGPSETSILCYMIDCLLVVLYWFLINKREPISVVAILYTIMFVFYFFWEFIRCFTPINRKDHRLVKNASVANLIFSCLGGIVIFLIKSDRWPFGWYGKDIDKILTLSIIFIIVLSYRIILYIIYNARLTDESFKTVQKWDNFMEIKNQEKKLIETAKSISKKARAHLSDYKVGAAILSEAGNIYSGCNIEFDNYSNTIHAEESAICSMITNGDTKPVKIAIYTSEDKLVFPCGMCRQSLFELGGNQLEVIACNDNKTKTIKMEELMPNAFYLER